MVEIDPTAADRFKMPNRMWLVRTEVKVIMTYRNDQCTIGERVTRMLSQIA